MSKARNLSVVPNQTLGMKNRIINGAMVIDQRNAGAVNTPANGGYSVDRWQSNYSGGGVYSCQQTTTAPAGFASSLKLTVTTADSSIAATDVYALAQIIEGYNIADFNEGSANAKTFTISFWVQSSVTGTYSVGVRSSSGDYGYAFNYTISAANTWTYVTGTVSGTALGTWVGNVNTAGMYVLWDLGSGSNRNIPANTWTAGAGFNTSSQTPWISTNGATFYITGVQLEVGSSATGFEYRQYGTELALCQRYFQWTPFNAGGYQAAGSNIIIDVPYKVTMRVVPSFAIISADPNATQIATNNSANTFSATYSGVDGAIGYLQPTATGSTQVLGYRSATSAEL